MVLPLSSLRQPFRGWSLNELYCNLGLSANPSRCRVNAQTAQELRTYNGRAGWKSSTCKPRAAVPDSCTSALVGDDPRAFGAGGLFVGPLAAALVARETL